MFHVLAGANHIIEYSDLMPSLVRLHKLCYISHGFSLAIFNTPLFFQSVDCGEFGPIYNDLDSCYRKGKLYYNQKVKYKISDKNKRDIVHKVCEIYKDYEDYMLCAICNDFGTPYQKAIKNNLKIIPNPLIKEHYDNLRKDK